jgi:hypothetical protein
MQRTALWLGALLLVACNDRHQLDLTAPRLSPTSENRQVVVTDPDAAYGVMLNSGLFAAPIPVATALFGAQVTANPSYALQAQLVRTPAGASSATDIVVEDGCTPFSGDNIAGNIVLIDRGGCDFALKVLNAQNAGAVGVIIRDNLFSQIPPRMGADGIYTPEIPAFSVTRAQGTTLRNAIVSTGPVPIQLVVTPVDQPTVRLPDDITVNATSSDGAAVSFSVFGTAFRNLGGVGCSAPSGTRFPIGTTTVTCTTTDIFGNAASGSFRVTVRPLDTTPPTIAAAPDVTAELTSPGGATVQYSPPTAVDDDGQAVSVSCNTPSGSFFPIGATTVLCTATDAAGNTASASFVVRVVDTTPPTLTMPPNVITNATSTAGATVTFAATAADLSGPTTITCSPASGSTFPIGTTTVGCQARDASGNVSTGSFTVSVKGAAAQITDLQQSVAALDLQDGTETSVQAKLSAALDALNAHNVVDACGSLGALINQINAQTGKKISLADAQALIAVVQRIRSAAGC